MLNLPYSVSANIGQRRVDGVGGGGGIEMRVTFLLLLEIGHTRALHSSDVLAGFR